MQGIHPRHDLGIRSGRAYCVPYAIHKVPEIGSFLIGTHHGGNPQAGTGYAVEELFQGAESAAPGKNPQLIAYIIVKPRPWFSVGGTEGFRVVHRHRGWYRDSVTVVCQTCRKLKIVIPDEKLRQRQPAVLTHHLCIHQD